MDPDETRIKAPNIQAVKDQEGIFGGIHFDYFLINWFKHVFWVLKITVLLGLFF